MSNMTEETQQPDAGDGTLDGTPLDDVPNIDGEGGTVGDEGDHDGDAPNIDGEGGTVGDEGELGDDELGGAGPA